MLSTVRALVSGGQGGALAEATVFELLQNRRRRFALHHLKQRDGPVRVGDLATQVAAWETDKQTHEVTTAERRRVHVSLLQTHLPAMDAAGVVERDEDTVDLTPAAAGIDVYVELMRRDDLLWEEYYLALSALVGAFLVVLSLEVYPFDAVADRLWLALVVSLFLVSAVVHYLYQRRVRLGTSGPPPEIGRTARGGGRRSGADGG